MGSTEARSDRCSQEGIPVSSLHVNRGSAQGAYRSGRLSDQVCDVLSEAEFRKMLALERKRVERTQVPFLLMLAECTDCASQHREHETLAMVGSSLRRSSRETDVIGWYRKGEMLGMLFTGLALDGSDSVVSMLSGRVRSMLERELTPNECRHVRLVFHRFPDDWDLTNPDLPGDPAIYVDIMLAEKRNGASLAIKRLIDVLASAAILIACSPLFLLIALAIKFTSKGPVLFRQKRIGQYGRQFTFLKFRSMHVNNSDQAHKKFVKELISGNTERHSTKAGNDVRYKIKDDKRVTPIGRILRRTSLDELPQLFNVLKGDMSLVGPRPAIPYEVELYLIWHRRRVLAAKPGITGIWQVTGRSRVKFDEMVRMDLRYAMAWSPWLDLKILLRTPLAVIRGSGAF